MSAMNGATRLRYGKRSNPSSLEPSSQIFGFRQPSRWVSTAKRMAFSENLPALVDSLNGAERLRFFFYIFKLEFNFLDLEENREKHYFQF